MGGGGGLFDGGLPGFFLGPLGILSSEPNLNHHTVGYDSFIQSQLPIRKLTLGSYVVQIWSRSPQNRGERNADSPTCDKTQF